MKVSRNKLFQQLIKELEETSNLQKSGGCMLTQKVAYALSKNLKACYDLLKDYTTWRESILPEFVIFEKKAPKVEPDEKGLLRYVFINDDLKAAYHKTINQYTETEIDFTPHKVELKEIELCQNVPISTLVALEEFEIVTELSLSSSFVKPDLNVIN